MTTTLTPAAPARRSAPAYTRPGLARLTLVELRKLADTRAGMWLLVVIGLGAVVTTTIMLIFADGKDQTLNGFLQFGLLPASVLLPVLGILSMTGEWTQRTALATFTLVPVRGRILVAKVAAGVLIAVVTTAAALLLAVVGELIAGGHHWDLTAALTGQAVLSLVAYMLVGLGFGAALMNSALAIVVYLVLPTVWSILTSMIKSLRHVAQWVDLGMASTPLASPGVTGVEWARFGVAVAIWAGLALAVGFVRAMRREVA